MHSLCSPEQVSLPIRRVIILTRHLQELSETTWQGCDAAAIQRESSGERRDILRAQGYSICYVCGSLDITGRNRSTQQDTETTLEGGVSYMQLLDLCFQKGKRGFFLIQCLPKFNDSCFKGLLLLRINFSL